MNQAEGEAAARTPKSRWHQYRLRTLFILTALVALVASCFRPAMQPSPLFDVDLGRGDPPIDNVLLKVVPRTIVRGSIVIEGGGSDATPLSGRWYSSKFATIQCPQEFADQMMRRLRTEVKRYVTNAGAEIADEAEDVKGSTLTGFRLAYTHGIHRGSIKVMIEPGRMQRFREPPEKTPIHELRWDVEELAGGSR